MAKRNAATKKPVRAAAGPTRGAANRMLILLTVIALIPFSLPTVLVLCVGMLPTLGAAMAERGEGRYLWVCVGGLNFTGVAPWLFTLWFGHHELNYAFQQVTSVSMLLASFGGAALGWLLYLAMPPLVSTIMTATSQRRAIVLGAQQRKLVEQWGDEVLSQIEDEVPPNL